MFNKVPIVRRMTHGIGQKKMCCRWQYVYIGVTKNKVAQPQCLPRASTLKGGRHIYALDSGCVISPAQRGAA